MVTTTKALLLSLQMRLQHSPNTRRTLHELVEDEDSRRLRHVDARDRRERAGNNHPRVKRTRRGFPLPTYKESFICVCAEILWCKQTHVSMYVVERLPLMIIFERTLFKKQYVQYSCFIIRVVDPILPVLFCYPKTHLILVGSAGRIRYYKRGPY